MRASNSDVFVSLLFQAVTRSRFLTTSLILLVICCLLVAGGPALHAQQATALITGTIRDESGAIVVGAHITLKNSDTNVARSLNSDKDGNYVFPLIPIGTYEVTVEQKGFDTYIRKGITLEINQNAHLDIALKVGTTSQVVEVTGAVAQVDTVSSTLGKVETTQRILDLPLVERDTMQLGLLQAGVFVPEQEDGSGNPFNVSGQRSESLTFLIDGADNNDFLGNNMVVNPNPDAVDEFKILTNDYEAEYGRTSGGIVNQVIKSGTNQIHGSLFEFFRNDALDASDYFTQNVPVYKRNLFGGSVGFPIVRNKAFMFASYQGARRREGQVAPPFETLSSAERTGDFTELYTGVTDPNTGLDTGQLYNPATGNPYTCGTAVCNQIPVDPVIANYINDFVPLPNLPGNQFISAPSAALQDDQFIFRFDYNFSSKDVLSAFYIFDDQPQVFPFEILHGASTGGDVPNGSGFTNAQRYQTGSLNWTHTITPTLLNEFRFATNRSATFDASPTDKATPSSLGFTTVFSDDPAGAAPPLMSVNGAFALGPSPQGPTKVHDTTFQYQDTVSWTHGQHAFKFGADLRWVENNFNYDFYNNGSFFFGDFGAFTASPASPNISSGSVLADFVGGFFDNYYQFSTARYGIRTHSLYFFGQDAWKVTKDLTLDLGLRYEYNSPQYDPHNEIMGWFPGQQSTVFPGAPPDFLYPGDPGTPNRALVYPDKNNFAPRVGFAWNMLGNAKLVMRGGFGVFYDIEDGALNLQFGGQPPFGYVANNYPCYSSTPGQGCLTAQNGSYVTDPFQGIYPDPFPFAQKAKVGTFFSPAIPYAFVVTPHFRTPYAYHFNYGFQYQLTPTTMVEGVYVGSLSRKAIATNETNYALLSVLEQQYALNGYDGLNPECARPLAACDSPLDPDGVPTGAQQIYTNLSDANSSSNEFQLSIDKQLSHGIQFRTAYTLSKTIDDASGFRARSSTYTDPTNPGFDRALADFDARQRLVISPIYRLPFLAHSHSLLGKVAGGWNVSSIISFQSGNPFTIFSNNNSSELDNYLDRADVVGPVEIFKNPREIRTFSPSSDGVHGSCLAGTTTGHFWFDPTNLVCSVGPPVGETDPTLTTGGVPLFTHGDAGRNTFHGPGFQDWDISLLKDFHFTEGKYFEFQAGFFNAFNHVQFYGPTSTEGASGGSGNFGMVTSDTSPSTTTAYYRGPRLIQFALKLYF
jgi:outer membrane receptor protein involved in Fe transport